MHLRYIVGSILRGNKTQKLLVVKVIMAQKLSLPEHVRNELKNYLRRDFDIENANFTIEYGSKNGDSYSSDIYRLIVIDSELSGDEKRRSTKSTTSLQLILKMSPTAEVRRQMFNTSGQFAQEHYAYTIILPALQTFQLQHLNKQDIFNNYPKIISGSLNPKQEYILFEDMYAQGYNNFNRLIPLKFHQCAAVFKALAKLHAVSFAYKDQHPEEFNKLIEPLDEIVFTSPLQDGLEMFLRQKIDCAISTLSDGYKDNVVKEHLLEFQKVFGNSMIECVSERAHAAILHGDCWVSNLLYRKRDLSADLDITFLDWQICRYGTPIVDLSYFIFCCTDSELRTKLLELLEIYYQSLTERISALGSDPTTTYPYSIFQNHLKKYMKFGFGMALMSLHSISCSPDEMPDVITVLENSDFETFNIIAGDLSKKDAYRERMSAVCRDVVNFGYI